PFKEGPAKDRVLVPTGPAPQDLTVEIGVELRAATVEFAELLPAAFAHESRREPQSRRPAPGARVHRVDRLLREIESELATEELDRLGARECELRRGDVEDGSRQPPASEAAELRRAPRCQHEVGIVGK